MGKLMFIGFRKLIRDAETNHIQLVKEYRENGVADEAKRRQIDQARARVEDLKQNYNRYIDEYISNLKQNQPQKTK